MVMTLKIVSATEDVLDTTKKGRWYDLDGTLRTAISLLQNCPESTRRELLRLRCTERRCRRW